MAGLGLLLSVLAVLASCARIAAVGPGRVELGAGFSVQATAGWNRLPQGAFGADEAWTRDGAGLDILLFIAGRGEGEPLFTHPRERKALLLRADMTPTEVMELWATEMALAGRHMVTVGGLMPVQFAGVPAFRFQYAYADAGGLVFDGYATGAMIGGRLYLVAFCGTRAHHFRAYWPAAAGVIGAARIAPG